MNDKADLLRAYVLEAGGGDDARLRAVLADACPECDAELSAAEADLATFALALPPVAPPAALRGRVLAQMAAAAGATAAGAPVVVQQPSSASANYGGPGAVAPRSPSPRRRVLPVALVTAIVLLVSGVIGAAASAMLLATRQEDRMAILAERLDDLRLAQTGAGGQLDDIVERLKRTRSLAEALKEREARLARVDSELVDLRGIVATGGGREAEVAQLKQQLAVLRSAKLSMFDVAGTERQPGAKARLLWDRDGQRWLLSATGLTPPADGRCFELWFITTDGRKIGSKTFVADAQGRAELLVDVPQDIGPIALAAITDEPIGGVAIPTGQIHLAGKVN